MSEIAKAVIGNTEMPVGWFKTGGDGARPKCASAMADGPPARSLRDVCALDNVPMAMTGPAGLSHRRTPAQSTLATDLCAADKSP